MDIQNRRELKRRAEQAIRSASYDPRKLILLHCAVSALLGVVLAAVTHLLELGIDGTGGLGGIGTRAILETIQNVLGIAQLAVTVFWQIGFTYCALRISRAQSAQPRDLLEGFRRFGPVLRLRLLVGLLCGGVAFASVYLACVIFAFLPWAAPLEKAVTAGTEEALMAAMEACALPLAVVMLIVLAALFLPYWYRLRLADLALMDDSRTGAAAAVRMSRYLMHGNRWNMLKLDLSFWWFYALEMLTLVVAYGDILLPMFGVELPWSNTVSYYVFLILCYGCQMALYWWKGSHLQVAYAEAYRALLPSQEPAEQ